MDTATIRSKELEVNFALPRLPRVSQRFDACGVVNEVTLCGRHTFCVPEQRIPGRVTTWGLGLCGEFTTPGIAARTAAGERFPKLGVGLLTQKQDGREHNVWESYVCEPFTVEIASGEDFIEFSQQPKDCNGYGAAVVKRYDVRDNRLELRISVENCGTLPLPLREYQHNFVSVDHLQVGKGYRLELPFVRDMSVFADCCKTLGSEEACPSFLESRGNRLYWTGSMEGRFWIRILEGENLLPCAGAYWTLSHRESPATISESLSFVPSRAVLWGISHCICTELYFAKDIAPGEKACWQRTWTFTEEESRGKER